MPIAQLHVLAGHPRPRLQQLLREVSQVYADVLSSPIERLQVWIQEIDPGLYAVGGEPLGVPLTDDDRFRLEVPLARLVILSDRPAEQVTRLIESLTEVIARVLGADPTRVRVMVQRVPPEAWGIGGVSADVRRRAEIEARKKT